MKPKNRTIPDDVLDILRRGKCEGDSYTMPQLERTDYVRVNKVLETACLKWNRKAKVHVCATGDAAEAIEALVVTGSYILPADFGAFDTPPDLALDVVSAANIKPGMLVLEPSAGKGNLVQQLVSAGAEVSAVELQSGRFPKELEDSPQVTLTVADFMDFTEGLGPIFDRVVMNPPFSGKQDVRHVTLALGWLKPEGRLVSIMSAGVKFRQDRETIAFRELVYKRGGEIDDLPQESFKAAGTSVNTIMVTIPGG